MTNTASATSQTLSMGAFQVSLVLDADGHLSVYTRSTDGSPVVDITDDMGRDDEVCLRVTTEATEAASECPANR